MKRARIAQLAALALAVVLVPFPARRVESQGAPQSVKPVQNGCHLCHAEYVREWRDSHHGLAWTDSLYQAAKDKLPKDQQAKCLPCHIPNPVQVSGPGKIPAVRTKAQDEGVACVSCHQIPVHGKPDDIGTIVGPYPVDQMAKSHPYKHDKSLVDSIALCASCHGIDRDHNQVESWKGSVYEKEKVLCQHCHMPEVKRAIHDKRGAIPREGRKHTWPGARDAGMLKKAATLDVAVEGGKVRVGITNSGAGHNFPGSGEREVVLIVTVTGADGKEAASYREVFDLRTRDNRIKPKERRALEFDAKAATGMVKVRLLYKLTPEWDEAKAAVAAEHEAKF
ncbi:MAG: hypothetical protein HUU15_06940 [Candidatus Brocadiae bacterium]|nr:hypothetical protein [Candidatus Brocadiia bacterium]